MNKKGQGLPLNTVIVAILVILVLVVVVIFFLGGMSGLTSKIKTMFFGTLAGTDETIAVQTCETRCEQVKLLPTTIARRNSAYCDSPFNIDANNDGEADKVDDEYIKFYCFPFDGGDSGSEQSLNVDCPGLPEKCLKPV